MDNTNRTDHTEKQLSNESASKNIPVTENCKPDKNAANVSIKTSSTPIKQPSVNEPETVPVPSSNLPVQIETEIVTAHPLPESNGIVNTVSQVNSVVQVSSPTGPPALPNSERKLFPPSIKSPITTERKPTEGAGIVIKKDYLPSPAKAIKVEKTREDVTRALNYESECNQAEIREKPVPLGPIVTKTEPETAVAIKIELGLTTLPEKSVPLENNKENADIKLEKVPFPPKKLAEEIMRIKVEMAMPNKVSSTESADKKTTEKQPSSSNRLTTGDSHHSKSSSKSSSRRSSTSSSNRECSRCYKRAKIKRTNIGVQCQRSAESLKNMAPSATPLKITQLSNCNVPMDEALSQFKYARFFHVEVHSNGGASVVHMYQNEIDTLPPEELDDLVDEYFKLTFSEDENGFAHHVMGIVHDAAAYLPDLLEHMADNYSTLTVKAGVLGRNSDIETSTLSQYYEQVAKQYSQGTFRYGPLHQISLVGKVHEEVGGYFPDLLGRLEQNPFLNKVRILYSPNTTFAYSQIEFEFNVL